MQNNRFADRQKGNKKISNANRKVEQQTDIQNTELQTGKQRERE